MKKITLNDKYKAYLKIAIFNYRYEDNNIYINDYLIKPSRFPQITQRDIDIVMLKDVYKLSYKKIGDKYNLTKQRIFSIYKTTKENIKFKYFLYLINY